MTMWSFLMVAKLGKGKGKLSLDSGVWEEGGCGTIAKIGDLYSTSNITADSKLSLDIWRNEP